MFVNKREINPVRFLIVQGLGVNMSFIYLIMLHLVILLAIPQVCHADCAIAPVNGHVTIPDSVTNISSNAFYMLQLGIRDDS